MAIPKEIPKAYLIISVLFDSSLNLDEIREKLKEKYGEEDITSPVHEFQHTNYYAEEMGNSLKRIFIGYKTLVPRESIPELKLTSNELELNWLENGDRLVNLDPGIVNRENLILATAKNFTNRIYMGKGIFANLELIYHKQGWQKMPWTYPDYSTPEFLGWLTKFRNRLIELSGENVYYGKEQQNKGKKKMKHPIVILFGGTSTERKVSVASAQHVSTLFENSYLWFIAKTGEVHYCNRNTLQNFKNAFTEEFDPETPVRYKNVADALDDLRNKDTVFLLALHGGDYENGSIQKLFEDRKLAFTGSGSLASKNAFDKALAKEFAQKVNVYTAEAVLIYNKTQDEIVNVLTEFYNKHGRIVAKPQADGSSVGLCHIIKKEDICEAAKIIFESKAEYIVENFIKGRELTVGVYGEPGNVKGLPVSEVRMEEGLAFDYNGKYLGKGSTEITPADISSDMVKLAQETAIKVHESLGCFGYSRTDMIMTEDAKMCFLETNTLPGLTRASFIPQQTAAANIPIKEFLTWQMEFAIKRNSK